MKLKWFIVFLFFFTLSGISAQMSRKPSMYDYKNRQNYNNQWEQAEKIKTKIPYLSYINFRMEFDLLCRTFDKGTEYEIPHLLFTISRKDNKISYINTLKYTYHVDFIRDQSKNKTPDIEIFNINYKEPDREFILGTIAWLKNENKFVYEFWEGDILTPELLKQAQTTISSTFNAGPIIFKTNSTLHEKVGKSAGIKFITQEEIIKGQIYIALNKGKAKGRLKIIKSAEDVNNLLPDDILILKETPISLPPVAGVISEQPSTILSHVNILTRNWGIPNVYLKNASNILAEYEGKYIELNVTQSDYSVKLLSKIPKNSKQIRRVIELPNLSVTQLFTLNEIRKNDNIYCGSKAANLGEIKARIRQVDVPDGFSIPFAQYDRFMRQNNLYKRLDEMEKMPGFNTDVQVRKQQLEKLRNNIVAWDIDKKIADIWVRQWQTQLNGKGVFVRSSSNSEDLPDFSGAGLYTTIPNVKTPDELIKSVKSVWASIFNYEAYEARRHAGIPQNGVMMSVFIQLAVDSDCSGVMITKDPFDDSRNGITYIAAKRGIGIKVVEGKKIAEQYMHSNLTGAIQQISKSAENTELRLQTDGGIKEVRIKEDKPALSDDLILKLVKQGQEIRYLFGNTQDIEWAVKDGNIIILQARPYVD